MVRRWPHPIPVPPGLNPNENTLRQGRLRHPPFYVGRQQAVGQSKNRCGMHRIREDYVLRRRAVADLVGFF